MAPLALILASFATQLWQIYLTQGILYGFSATFAFSPAIALPSQWFVKKRAFVTGLAVSGSGIGGVCMSPMAQALITELGYRNALRVMGSMMFALLAIATALARSRWNLKSSPGHKWYELVDTSLLTRDFNLLWLFCLLAPFGYLAPFFLAPTYASYIGASDQQGAAIVSIMSATNAVCRITLGYCGDKFGRINTMFVSTFLSALFSMLVWQFCRSYGPFVAYGLFFGLVSGAFVALTPAIAADIIGVENIQKGIGMLYFATTVGNLLGTPISGLLQQNFGWTATIQYCGAMSLAAALVALILRLSRSWGKKSAWYARY
ncbi:major facilitator superfamily domain-containing protein [Gongronella butleri]|nr:major facilitator superfamily domain-containing protein [Gongronella butleri]